MKAMKDYMRIAAVAGALCLLAQAGQAAPRPAVVKDVASYGFPDFLTAINGTTKGWIFAPPFVGLKWVELNGVLLIGNTGASDPETGLAFTASPTNYVVAGVDWAEADQRPARNGICRGSLLGNKQALGLRLSAPAGHACLVEILALGGKQPRAFNVVINGQVAVTNWTVQGDRAANRLLRVEVEAGAEGIDLQFTPGNAPGADPNPALSALALTDTTGGLWQYDPAFGRIPPGMVNIAPAGLGSSPDGLEQDGAGKGDQAGIDGDPNTYWDESDRARLYRYMVTFPKPEKIAALAVMGWAQHDFAPKDFEVLCDGQVVKTVAGAQYVKNIFQLPLEEITCRTVELKITGYYGGSPAIRELGIFSREPHPNLVKAVVPAPAEPPDGGPVLAEWPLVYQKQRALWYVAGKYKPYVKEWCTTAGRNVLRDAPYDHLHHHGLMYAIKVNGVNFWEEVAGSGYQKPVATTPWVEGKTAEGRPQFTLKQTLHWVTAADAGLADTAKAALLIEQRTLTVIFNEAQKEVALQWKGEFEVGPKTNVVTLTGANYHGLGMRFLKEFDPLAKHLNAGGGPDLNGRQDVSRHKWGSVAFDQPGKPATVALFGHPANARGEAWFFTMKSPFAYLSATQNLDQEPLKYRAGEKFQVNYLLTLYPDIKTAADLQARGRAWENAKP